MADRSLSKDELLRLRQEGGRWLRGLREAAKVSQRELAEKLGSDYYSYVSQIESGKGAIPPGRIEVWASVVGVNHRYFALNIIKYYESVIFRMIFGSADSKAIVDQYFNGQPVEPPKAPLLGQSGVDGLEELRSRVARLEALLLVKGAAGGV